MTDKPAMAAKALLLCAVFAAGLGADVQCTEAEAQRTSLSSLQAELDEVIAQIDEVAAWVDDNDGRIQTLEPLLDQSCPDGRLVEGIDEAGALICSAG